MSRVSSTVDIPKTGNADLDKVFWAARRLRMSRSRHPDHVVHAAAGLTHS
jgi:hypothetical protein